MWSIGYIVENLLKIELLQQKKNIDNLAKQVITHARLIIINAHMIEL